MFRDKTTLERSSPFVGPDSIQTGQFLFGRDNEVRDLVDMLIAKRIVLLHSPSGAGKSSLINAGLIPALEEELFTLYPVMRVNKEPGEALAASAASERFNRYVYSAILSLDHQQPDSERMDAAALAEMTLTEYLELRAAGLAANDAVVLIFDQFEEIITADPIDLEAKEAFFKQLGQALRNPRRWAIFAMRDDYVGALDPYLGHVPTHLSVRLHLDLLTVEAAQQAIRRPAPDDKSLAAASFFNTFTVEAAEHLAEDLRQTRVQLPDGTSEDRPGPYVEPVQLQVVCKRLWEGRPEGMKEIDVALIEKTGTVNDALAGYYADNMARIAAGSRVPEWRIREWFGRSLITAQGIRGQVMRGTPESEQLGDGLIRQLMNAYLVREERRRGVTWYELAHDRLVGPIRQNNEHWQRDNLSPFYAQAARWRTMDRPRNLLLSESQLATLELWERENPGSMTVDEEAYLDASRDNQEQARARQLAEAERQTNLDQLGWGVIFGQDVDPAVYEALSELLTIRQTQATAVNPDYYREFAYQENETARQFLARQGISAGPVEPDKVPYYLLIVGSPEEIPFEFQYELDMQYAVGRIYFEETAAYNSYARSVVAAEEGLVKLPRRATFFGPDHEDDQATKLTARHLVQPMFERARLEHRDEWRLDLRLRGEATKGRLNAMFAGVQTPAVLFVAGHGMEFEAGHEQQLEDQGAIVCQDWPGPGNVLTPEFYFSASDLPEQASLIGMIAFFASAYSAGVPAEDDFAHVTGRSKRMADAAFLARLPLHMLGHPGGGVLAFCGHVDRPWITEGGALEMPVYSEVIRRLMDGHTVGSAMEVFNQRYTVFASRVSERLRRQWLLAEESDSRERDFELRGLMTAMIDARNFIIIGDPAVRLSLSDDPETIVRPTIRPAAQEPVAEPLSPAPLGASKKKPAFRAQEAESAYVELEIRVRAREATGDGAEDDGASIYGLEIRLLQPQSDLEMQLVDEQVAVAFQELAGSWSDALSIGRRLTSMLLGVPSVPQAFSQARTTAEIEGVPLRIRLWVHPDASELQSIPWETLVDPGDPAVLFFAKEDIFFSRYVSSLRWRPVKLRKRADLKALVVIACPSNLADYGLPGLDVEAELVMARAAMGSIPFSVLAAPGAATLDNIMQGLLEDVAILYIVAHGRQPRGKGPGEYGLFLVDQENEVRVASGGELAQRLAALSDPPQLVALSLPEDAEGSFETSQTPLAPRLIEAGVPAVLAMQQHVSQEVMSRFMAVMFKELWRHGEVDRAVAGARSMLRREEGAWSPALFMRLKSGRIWRAPRVGGFAPALADAHFQVPSLPANYVPRAALQERVASAVHDSQTPNNVVALTGPGGIGKTALAIAVCYEASIRSAFPDGILWLDLGRDDPAAKLLDKLVQAITGDRIHSLDQSEAKQRWLMAARDRSFLLVLDNVWQAEDLAPFLAPSPGSKYLVTTRNALALPEGTVVVELGPVSKDMATEILGAGLPEDEQVELVPLVEKLGRWPLALRLANGALRDRLESRQSLPEVVDYLNRAIDRRGIAAFDKRSTNDPDQSLLITLEASDRLLDTGQRERLYELAIFPAETPIPLEMLRILWEEVAHLDSHDVEIAAADLDSKSWIELESDVDVETGNEFDRGSRSFRVHKVISNYLMQRMPEALDLLHEAFMTAVIERGPEMLSEVPADRRYLQLYWLHHLSGAGRELDVRQALHDFRRMREGLALAGVDSLLNDFDYLAEQDARDSELLAALRLSAPIVEKDPALLAGQLTGRLRGQEESDWLFSTVSWFQTEAWLRPLAPTLFPAAGNMAGHGGPVTQVVATPDGTRVVSASWDKKLKIWSLKDGRLLRTLEGHEERITSVAVSSDGKRAVSVSLDGAMLIWDLGKLKKESQKKATPRDVVEAHQAPVWDVGISPQLPVIFSASGDKTIAMWHLSGGHFNILEGHTGWVHHLAFSPDHNVAASASWDGTIRVWHVVNGETLQILEGHAGLINRIVFTPEPKQSRLVSAADDGAIRVWDVESGRLLRAMTDLDGPVSDLAVTPDGRRVVAAAAGATLQIWNLEDGALLHTLTGHSGAIRALSMSPDGSLAATADGDGFIRLWDLAEASLLASFKGDGAMLSCAFAGKDTHIVAGDSLGRVHLLRLEFPQIEPDAVPAWYWQADAFDEEDW